MIREWLAPAMLFDAWSAAMASVMRAHLRTRDTLMVIVVMQVCTVLLALALMPCLGLPGYALALLGKRVTGLVLHLWLWRQRPDRRPPPSDWWRLPRRELAAMLHNGLPGAAENIASGWPAPGRRTAGSDGPQLSSQVLTRNVTNEAA